MIFSIFIPVAICLFMLFLIIANNTQRLYIIKLVFGLIMLYLIVIYPVRQHQKAKEKLPAMKEYLKEIHYIFNRKLIKNIESTTHVASIKYHYQVKNEDNLNMGKLSDQLYKFGWRERWVHKNESILFCRDAPHFFLRIRKDNNKLSVKITWRAHDSCSMIRPKWSVKHSHMLMELGYGSSSIKS